MVLISNECELLGSDHCSLTMLAELIVHGTVSDNGFVGGNIPSSVGNAKLDSDVAVSRVSSHKSGSSLADFKVTPQ